MLLASVVSSTSIITTKTTAIAAAALSRRLFTSSSTMFGSRSLAGMQASSSSSSGCSSGNIGSSVRSAARCGSASTLWRTSAAAAASGARCATTPGASSAPVRPVAAAASSSSLSSTGLAATAWLHQQHQQQQWRRGVPPSFRRGVATSAATTEVASSSSSAAAAPAEQEQNGAEANGNKPAQRKRVLSGVQPTGKLHLGNYLGAIKNWVPLQEEYDTFFCVVDLHAITVQHDPRELRDATRNMAAAYLAAGIDPERASIFVQSHVAAHAELSWLLECVTPMGWLQRMIQFKEKARKQGEDVRSGLLTYPVLMAADILLYQADLVPVGEDQKQHLELTRDIAERVNHLYGGKAWKKRGGKGGRVLKVPEPFIPPAGARVMSLQDGTSKMSKSAENDASRINLTDDAAAIAAKIKRCKTDAFDGLEFGNPDRPEASNLLTLYQLATGRPRDEVAAECASMRWGTFKPLLADALVAHLEPIQKRYNEAAADRAYLDGVLARGAENAAEQANATLAAVRDAMGFVPPARKF